MNTILFVDDLEQNRYLVRSLLGADGYEMLEAANGSEALELAHRTRPDLIISDILMPQMDGFALCRACKRDEELRDIPFVFYTATYTDPRDEALALQLGAARFIIKTIENNDFVAIIHDVLQAQEKGQLTAPAPSLEEETDFYRLYNQALIRKLEDKMLDLERINRKLSTSEERFRRLAEDAPDLIFRYEFVPRRGFTYLSPAATAITGYTPEELYADPELGSRLIHPDDRPLWEDAVRADPLTRQPLTLRWVHKDGQIVWTEQRNAPIFNEAGEPIAIEGIVRDITVRIESERRIQRQLEHVSALREIDLAIMSSFDLKLTITILLEQIAEQLGADAADCLRIEADPGTLEYIGGRGFLTNTIEYARSRVANSLPGRAVINRSAVYISDLSTQPDYAPLTKNWHDEGFVGYYALPLIAKGEVKGVLEIFQRSRLDANSEWLSFLESMAQQATIAIDNATLFSSLDRANRELSLAYEATLEGWSRALDLRDKETEGHSERVTQMTLQLARAYGMSEAELVHVRRGALLHDIGKMGVPDRILLKSGPLTDEDWAIMRKHPTFAYELLSPIRYLRAALDIPYCHHEKWDGSGYPRGLKGEQIPPAARIFAVIDVWDALLSNRPYRSAWSPEQARDYIRAQAGIHFDPDVVEACLKTGLFDRVEGE